MRKLVVAAVGLVILIGAYWSWALFGTTQLASAAAQGDVHAVMQRIDLEALSRSLGRQVARAFLELNPQYGRLLPLERHFMGSAAAAQAEAFLRELLTPENIAALLSKGRGGLPDADARIWRMPPLSEAFRGGPWEILRASRFDGPLSFVVGLDSAEGRYDLHLHLSGATWRLSGLDLPDEVSARLAREIAEKAGGPSERRGG
jgi:hypothetical protein